ncbi:hypothetical protein [Glutamicibacter sp.]|uniref:hypothetical protein n=1 Tax=Glutamicibacter sp. TaxID=1931995 RepID=UPI0028BE76B1|nr:hypothetical protein [Glutamicibacter sp.]
MRYILIVSGAAIVIAYSLYGMFVVNDLAVAAASGVPLETAVAEMKAADQTYSKLDGIGFAAFGILLALSWSLLAAFGSKNFRGPMALLFWSGILFLGAPAYFFAAFGNLNSVGDTFYDWYPDAAFQYEWPMYLASALALLSGAGAAVALLVRKPGTGLPPTTAIA